MLHNYLLVIFMILLGVFGQGYVGDKCTLQSSKKPGTCQLFTKCPAAQEDLRKKRFPQPCGGFEGSQPIICCPEGQPEEQPKGRKFGEISRKKCAEYSAFVKRKIILPTLLMKPSEIEKDECGHKVVKLIVGGKPAEIKEFPHMAAVGFEPSPGQVQWVCGGTIISEQYVLTAAHCLSDYSQGDAKWVKIGVNNLNDRDYQQIKVIERIPYTEYRSRSHYHDIGLLKLEQGAELNPYAVPACLYSKPDFEAKTAIATGWGHTSYGGSGSNNLLKVTIDLFSHSYCNASYVNQISGKLNRGIVDEIQICAGSENEEKDTCQGDSGGPLQIYHIDDDTYCMYDIIGVTSFGKACSGSPGVYVRVSNYIKWIEDIVWP